MSYNPSDKANYIYDFTIENLSIQSDKITSHNAVELTATWGFICQNVTIENHKGSAILGKLNPNITDPDKSAMVTSKIENCDFFYNDFGIRANEIFSIENLDVIKCNIQWNLFCGIYGVITYLNINSGSIAFNGTGLPIGTSGPLAKDILYGGINIPISTIAAIPRNIRIIGCEIDSNWPQNIYIKCSYNAVIKQNAIASRLFPNTNYIGQYSVILGDSSGVIKNFNSEISSNLMRIPPSIVEFPEQKVTFVLSEVTDIGSIMNEQVYAINDAKEGVDYFFVEAKEKSGVDDTYVNQLKVVTQRGVGLMSKAYKLTYYKEFYVKILNNEVVSFRPPEIYGILGITRGFSTNNCSALIAYDLGANALNQMGNSIVNTGISLFTSTILTSMNGNSGKLNISEDSATGRIYILNKIGGDAVVFVTILNTSNAEI